MDPISYFLFSITSLFTVVNPFGTMPVFISMTEGLERKQAFLLARRATIIAFLAIMFFAISGKFLFSFFNISIDALRIVGGVLFFITGYDMLQGKVARTKSLSKEEQDEMEDVAISPLAVPLITGPGAITIATVLVKDAAMTWQKGLVFAAIAAVYLVNFVFLISSNKIMKVVGKSGNKVFSRLMGLMIMMIAIELFFAGLKPYAASLLGQ